MKVDWKKAHGVMCFFLFEQHKIKKSTDVIKITLLIYDYNGLDDLYEIQVVLLEKEIKPL